MKTGSARSAMILDPTIVMNAATMRLASSAVGGDSKKRSKARGERFPCYVGEFVDYEKLLQNERRTGFFSNEGREGSPLERSGGHPPAELTDFSSGPLHRIPAMTEIPSYRCNSIED